MVSPNGSVLRDAGTMSKLDARMALRAIALGAPPLAGVGSDAGRHPAGRNFRIAGQPSL